MRPAIATIGLCLALAALGAGCDHKPDLSLARMIRQPRAEPYAPSAFFRNGQVLQAPPDGTIPRERVIDPVRAEAREEGSLVDYVPLPVTRDLVARGRDRFDIYCAVCHGIAGDGECPVADKMTLIKPPSLHEPRLRSLKAGAIYQIVTQGYGLMEPYASVLSVDDRWAIVAYVQALQLSQNAPAAALPPAVQDELRRALK
jgi:mono/diheme cytochrome c family protein